jgi:hypothetical protein
MIEQDVQSKRRSAGIINKPLTDEEFRDLIKVRSDPFHFSTYVNVIHPVRGKVPFALYPYQKMVLWYFITRRFNIILKFRQGGLTELISMFCLWYAMYHSNKAINIISIKDVVAKKVLRKIKFMYKNLPPHLRVQIINGKEKNFGTASEMEFANGSLISSIPTTEEAGRSEALSLLVIDEAAIVRWANTIWAAAFPTLSTGGRAILNSTPYGVGNFFHTTWVDACAAGNDFNPIRLKWTMHPERDTAWYRSMAEMLGPRRTAQEIDGDFLTSGNSVFDLLDIRAIEDSLDQFEHINYREHPLFKPLMKLDVRPLSEGLKIFKLPDKKRRFYIGADVSTGRSRDYSAFTIMDDKGEEYGCFKMKLPINEFSKVLGCMGHIYQRAELAPESNDIGLGVAEDLQSGQKYTRLHYSVKILREKKEKRPKEEKIPGWYTTRKNRPVVIAELEEDIRTNSLICKDPFFVNEAYTFIYDEMNRPVAMGKGSGNQADADDLMGDENVYTDDAIMAKAITNHIRKIRRKSPIILPV